MMMVKYFVPFGASSMNWYASGRVMGPSLPKRGLVIPSLSLPARNWIYLTWSWAAALARLLGLTTCATTTAIRHRASLSLPLPQRNARLVRWGFGHLSSPNTPQAWMLVAEFF